MGDSTTVFVVSSYNDDDDEGEQVVGVYREKRTAELAAAIEASREGCYQFNVAAHPIHTGEGLLGESWAALSVVQRKLDRLAEAIALYQEGE